MSSGDIERPRLYLDIDGVIIAEDSPFETIRLNYPGEEYSPEVVRRLDDTGLDLVWLSSWEGQALDLSERIDALRGGRILEGRITSDISVKREALVADQNRSPSPFAWVDDMITRWTRQKVLEQLEMPSLLVSPDPKNGLNEAELRRIEAFAKTHTID